MAYTPTGTSLWINNPENFPTWALGEKLQKVLAETQYQTSAPSSAIATALITAMSVVCQGKIRIKKRGNLISPVSIWCIAIQESGERKSTIIKLLLKSVLEYSSTQTVKYSKLLEIYAARYEGWKSEGRGIQRKIRQKAARGESVCEEQQALLLHAEKRPVKPRTLKLIHENATPAAIIKNLSEYFPTTSLLSDEGHTVFNSRAMSDLGLLNKAWDGGTIYVDRVTDGTLVIDDPCLTVGLFVQRDVLINYFEGKGELARSSGLLARCYVIAPPAAAGTRYLSCSVESAEDGLNWFHARCLEILHSHIDESATSLPEKTILEFSPEAQVRWEREHDAIESQMLSGGFFLNFKDFGSKLADKIARLSALLHYFEGGEGQISLETLERSIAISDWFAMEFIRCFTPAPQPTKVQIEASLLAMWLANEFCSTGQTLFEKNRLLQYGPNSLRNKTSLNPVLLHLWQLGTLWEESLANDKTIYIRLNAQYFSQNLFNLCQHGLGYFSTK